MLVVAATAAVLLGHHGAQAAPIAAAVAAASVDTTDTTDTTATAAAITATTTTNEPDNTIVAVAVTKKRSARGAFNPGWVGDGYCDQTGGYNTMEHGFDGGDCCPPEVDHMWVFPYTPFYKDSGCNPTDATNSYTCGYNGYQCIDPFNAAFEGLWLEENSFTCPHEKRVLSELFSADVWPKTDACRDPSHWALQGLVVNGKQLDFSSVIIRQTNQGGSAACTYFSLKDCEVGGAYTPGARAHNFPIANGDTITETKWFVPSITRAGYSLKMAFTYRF